MRALFGGLSLCLALIANAGSGVGISLEYMDRSVSPKVDLFQYANGAWLKNTPIPVDRSMFGIDALTQVKTEQRLKALMEALVRDNPEPSTTPGKLATLYRDFMDEASINALARTPIDDLLTKIDALQSRQRLPALMGELSSIGVGLPFDLGIAQDEKDSSVMRIHLSQSELPLPDKSYYLDSHDPHFKTVREAYRKYLEAMLRDLGDPHPETLAPSLLILETRWARMSWDRERLRDPKAVYHPMRLTELQALTPGFDWWQWWAVEGLPRAGLIIVGQPDYLKASTTLMNQTPLPVIKAWLKLSVLRSFAPYLDEERARRQFAFESGVLRGIPEERERWKRALMLLEMTMGEGLGQAYVEAYFPPSAKSHIEALVRQLMDAYRSSIDKLDWLSPKTREAARYKLDHIRLKLGYPNHWRDYSELKIYPHALVKSIRSAALFESRRMIQKLKEPVDRDEWAMTPQTVNAYYNPTLNEIVFPAAQLQAPYFDEAADDAANYGNIGFIIGHELSHAFDDEGAEFDAEGNLKDWWTPEDHAEFKKRTALLVKAYNEAMPLPGVRVNGSLTLGENIADNVGLTMAWRAYQASLGGRTAPLIEGLTGPERFFISYAQSWMGKFREESLLRLLKTDPHAPMDVRTNYAVKNQDAFHEAFGTAPGDPLWLAPEDRVKLW